MATTRKSRSLLADAQALVNQSGKQYPAARLVRDHHEAALISKLVRSTDTFYRAPFDEQNTGMTGLNSEEISRNIIARIEDNENIAKLFPDIELAIQIIISSILSPKDMFRWDLIFRTKSSRFPAVLTAKMTEIIRDELRVNYNIIEEQPDVLRETLFRSGATVKVILPESAVDELINGQKKITTESIYSEEMFLKREGNSKDLTLRHMGFLGNSNSAQRNGKIQRLSVESLFVNQHGSYDASVRPDASLYESETVDVRKICQLIQETVTIDDNYHFLKFPEIKQKIASDEIARMQNDQLQLSANRIATESYMLYEQKVSCDNNGKATPKELEGLLYKAGRSDYQPLVKVPTKSGLVRKSVGRPLCIDWPAESAIPVYVPGDPKSHIGYIFLCGHDGTPLTSDSIVQDLGQGLNSMLRTTNSNVSMASMLTDKASKNLRNDNIVPMLDNVSDLYAQIIEKDLMERIANGVYGRELAIGSNNEVYRIMFARAMRNKMTKMIYIPAEYVTYFAFEYRRNGTGASYLDDLTNITSLRAMVLFSKVIQKVKSSIAITHVDVELDQRDPDPQKTMEQAAHLVARTRQQYFPHGLNRVVDLTDWIQRAGIEMTFQNHPRIPQTKFNFEAKNFPHPEVDDQLDEMFRHQTYMHFGLSPETVDNAARADFATTVQQQSILFARRIMMLSNKHAKNLTDYTKKIVQNDQVIIEKLIRVILENKADLEKILSDEEKTLWQKDERSFIAYVIRSYLAVLETDLPKPDSTKVENLKTAIQAQEEMVDKALDYIFSQDIMSQEIAGEASNFVDSVRKAWKGEIMRKWMADNNYAPEVFDITKHDEDGKPMVDLLSSATEHSKNIMLSIASFIKEMKETKARSDADLQNANAGEEGSSSGSDYSSDSSNDNESTDDSGGEDEFGDTDNAFDNPEMTGEDTGGKEEGGEEGGNAFDDLG